MDLSILIPARNEQFLARTIEDILKNIEGDTEIIAVLDGEWSVPGIPQHPKVKVVYLPESIGQRAATNLACKLSRAKYVMKVDAHCSFDKGFDVKMIEAFKQEGDNAVIVPVMKNLHAFDWICKCGHRIYQGPTPEKCEKCGGQMEKEILWKAKSSPKSTAYRFDRTLHFQYWGGYKEKQIGDLVETMSLQGSCFMMTRKKYWELNICDESWGSWGNQGTEVSVKTWLSGGRVIVNKKTWYAHMFRTQGGDFSFPYQQSGRAVEKARQHSRDLFLNDKYPQAIHPFRWLIEKFNPPDWEDYLKEKIQKGIIFYTDNALNLKIAHKVQKQLKEISEEKNIPIVSSSLKPMSLGKNIVVKGKRGIESYFKQILTALENSTAEYIFFCEHDILYNESHFDFVPPTKDKFYFNTNVWKVDWETGKALWTDNLQQVSGMCCCRELALDHYKRRLKHVRTEKFNRRFEPETGNLRASYQSKNSIYDIRHKNNLTASRWSKDKFKNQEYTKGWKIKEIEGWEKIKI